MRRATWLLLGLALCAAATAGEPPTAAPGAAPGQQGQPPPPVRAPDADLIEFLGGDDVGDAAWWEFLRKAPPRRVNPPAPPPQDAKQ